MPKEAHRCTKKPQEAVKTRSVLRTTPEVIKKRNYTIVQVYMSIGEHTPRPAERPTQPTHFNVDRAMRSATTVS